jgi:LruC domain-containing protein/uncharacterized protein (TIGR02145 family)
MKLFYYRTVLAICCLLFLGACHKMINDNELQTNEDAGSLGLHNLSNKFTWNTSQDVILNLSMNIPAVGQTPCRVNIYRTIGNGAPQNIYAGSLTNGCKQKVNISVPVGCKQLSLELIGPDGNSAQESIIVNPEISFTFTSLQGVKATKNYADSDGDGIADVIDDFPNEKTKAFHYSYPSLSQGDGPMANPDWATICFEDLWPSMGDFDMNDLVVNYSWEITTDASHFVQTIQGHFKIKAAGSCAIWNHGFGVTLNGLPADQVHSVTGFNVTPGGYITLDGRGLEYATNGQVATPAVIIPFDDMSKIIHGQFDGFFNTLPGNEGTSDQIDITITMVSPYSVLDADVNPGAYNPFLIRNMERGCEIHKVDMPPTSWINTNYFGKSNDASNPSQNIYYRTKDKLPSAIDVPMDFNYSAEWVSIIESYPDFASWAESSGVNFPFWFTNPDFSKIYKNNGNRPPTATNVLQTGTAQEGSTLTGVYTYSDPENDPQGTSTFQWYRADDIAGLNEQPITGATAATYLLQLADVNKYIRFSVIPKAQTGFPRGPEYQASFLGPIASMTSNCGNSILDSRDGKTYHTVLIGAQCWMKENMNIGVTNGGLQSDGIIGKRCYNNLEINCNTYGGLYSWLEMMQYSTLPGSQGICPTGWHVPTSEEWTTLTASLGGSSIAGGKMKETGTSHWDSPNTGADNFSGFSALPGGATGVDGAGYSRIGENAYFWSSNEIYVSPTRSIADVRKLDYWVRDIYETSFEKELEQNPYFSVRCIKGEGASGSLVPTITASSILFFEQTTATCQAKITDENGAYVTSRGMCWSTSPNPTISDSYTTNGRGNGEFVCNITNLSPNTQYYVRSFATNNVGTAYGNELAFTTLSFSIGQSYGGGIIFFIDGTGQHGLIAAPSDQGTTQWGCSGTRFVTNGTGQENTLSIVTGCPTPGIAARICYDLVLNGYDDWFLPSITELGQMDYSKDIIGGFSAQRYWCSNNFLDPDFAFSKLFYSSDPTIPTLKGTGCGVRAIRAF